MSKEVHEERTPRTVADVKEMLSKHSNGEIQRTIQNCITILQNDHVLANVIRLNLLSERIDIVKPVGWPRSGKTLSDTDMKYILRRMEKYGVSSEKKIESAIRIVANENRYHPIRDYLNGLKWDGTERMGNSLLYILTLSVAFGRVRPGGRTLFLFCPQFSNPWLPATFFKYSSGSPFRIKAAYPRGSL